ncbi:MAG: hypothetical protein ACTHN5_18330 [Phycisphaerae bacterium]
MNARHTRRALAIAILIAAATPAFADNTYIGSNTTWSNPAAWSSNAPPLATDNVLVLTNSPGSINTLTLDTSPNVLSLFLGDTSTGTALLNLNARTLHMRDATILSRGIVQGPGNFTLASTLLNSGTLSATDGALLSLSTPASIDNTNGTISATGQSNATTPTPSEIDISTPTLSGGQLLTDASGTIHLGAANISNLQINGNVYSNNSPVALTGTIAVNGNWHVMNYITFPATQSLVGNGTLRLDGTRLISDASAAVITIGPSLTLSGYGSIVGPLNNAGNILASSGDACGTIQIFLPADASNSSVSLNTGTIGTKNGSILSISGGSLNNTNGTIVAAGSRPNGTGGVALTNTTITGGTLSTDDAALIGCTNATLANLTVNGTLHAAGTLRNVTLNGSLLQIGAVTLLGTIVNNAAWTQSSPAGSTINISSPGNFPPASALITGTGSITLNNGHLAGGGFVRTLTLDSNQTLQGDGLIQLTSSASFINLGTLLANKPGTTLTINAALTNFGTLAASPASTLAISKPLFSFFAPIQDDGSLQINAAANTTAITGLGNLTLNAGSPAAPALTSDALRLNSLTLNGSARVRPHANTAATSTLHQLLFASPSASLDLTTTALILSPSSPNALDSLQAALFAGASHSAGLFTTLPQMALALIDNASLPSPHKTFAGLPVDPNSLLIAPAFPGDTNLDGTVDQTDLSQLLAHLNQTTPNWTDGNFDHSPTVDLTDLAFVLNNFGQSAPPFPSTPEPATLLLLTIPFLPFTTRRPRRSTT